MDFRILGPLEVYDGERPLALGGSKQRALLGLLLLHANEVVSSDRLVEELWGEDGLNEGSKALHVAVSRLRRVIEPDEPAGQENRILVTRPPGYALRVERGQLDLHRFEDLLAAGRSALAAGDAATASATLRDALSLWRGPPLADLTYESFAQAEIARLDELNASALEERIAAELDLGGHQGVIGELQGLVGHHPLRERLRALLMLALYRSGRQAEALEAYRDGRRALIEEVGIEPGRELQELHAAILRQDAQLDHTTPAEPETGMEPSVFVGRNNELAELTSGLDDSFAGRGRLFLLAGEPGAGKSRLADELIGQARARGARVLVGRCWEAGGAPAYWPWIQSLRAHVRETEPEALRKELGTGAVDLAQLLPELRDLFPDLPQPPPPGSEATRFRLFGAVSFLLRRASQAHPLVLVLDDLHAADEPSLLLLQFVAREIADSRLLVVCAFRDVDPTMRDPLSSALAEIVREPHSGQITLAGLSEADVAEYVELSTGIRPPPKQIEAIHAETEGNPLFVAEVVRLLDAEGRIDEADVALRIPPGVRAVIGRRLRRLSDRCSSLLVPAAVIGREFGIDVLAHFGELPRDEALEVLDEAMVERVIDDVPGSPERLRFAHALIRDTLYEELTSARRSLLHRHVGEALETVYAADLEPYLAEVAHHFFAAVPAMGAEKAIDYARRAGDRAASQLAYEEAARLYEMALPLLGKDIRRCELLLSLGDAQARAGDTAASKQSFREAADLAEGLGLSEHLARAALGYGGRFVWEASRDDAEHVPLLERALAAIGDEDSALRVRLLARFAGGPLRHPRFPRERRRALSEQGLAMARRLGDPETLAYALSGYNQANLSPEFTPKQTVLAKELIGLAMEVGDFERAAEGHELRAVALIELADMPGAKAELAAMSKLAEELRQPSQQWCVVVYRAHVALLEGELAEAEHLIAVARSLGERGVDWNAGLSYGMQLYMLRREQGRLGEVEEVVRRSASDYLTYPTYRCALAQIAAELGYTAEAQGALEDLAAGDFAKLPLDEDWLVSMGLLAEAATTLGDVEVAACLYRQLLPYDERVAVAIATISTGAVARHLGLLAATNERWDDAHAHYEDALAINERIGARSWLAHTQADYARMLLVRQSRGDSDKAVELLASARSIYRKLGMNAWAKRAGAAQAL